MLPNDGLPQIVIFFNFKLIRKLSLPIYINYHNKLQYIPIKIIKMHNATNENKKIITIIIIIPYRYMTLIAIDFLI